MHLLRQSSWPLGVHHSDSLNKNAPDVHAPYCVHSILHETDHILFLLAIRPRATNSKLPGKYSALPTVQWDSHDAKEYPFRHQDK